MRRALLLALLLAAPLAGAAPDARDVVANLVLEPRCPGLESPASAACFEVDGAAGARIVLAPAAGRAQPLMVAQLQNATVLHRQVWMCDDGHVDFGGVNVTLVVVTLHEERWGCAPRDGLVARGTLTFTPT